MQAQLVTLLDRGERGPRAAVSASRGSSTGPSFAWLLSAEGEPGHALSHLSLSSSRVTHGQSVSSSQVAPNEAQARPAGRVSGGQTRRCACGSQPRERSLPPACARGPGTRLLRLCPAVFLLQLSRLGSGSESRGILLFCSKSHSTCESCYGTSDVSQIPILKSWPHISTCALIWQ